MNTNQALNETTNNETINNVVFEPKTIVCLECRNHFSFSPNEQKYFYEQGFKNEPKRCANCRVVRRMIRNGQETSTLSKANCVECNYETTLPFLPVQGKPIFCTSCFLKSGGGKKRMERVS